MLVRRLHNTDCITECGGGNRVSDLFTFKRGIPQKETIWDHCTEVVKLKVKKINFSFGINVGIVKRARVKAWWVGSLVNVTQCVQWVMLSLFPEFRGTLLSLLKHSGVVKCLRARFLLCRAFQAANYSTASWDHFLVYLEEIRWTRSEPRPNGCHEASLYIMFIKSVAVKEKNIEQNLFIYNSFYRTF